MTVTVQKYYCSFINNNLHFFFNISVQHYITDVFYSFKASYFHCINTQFNAKVKL